MTSVLTAHDTTAAVASASPADSSRLSFSSAGAIVCGAPVSTPAAPVSAAASWRDTVMVRFPEGIRAVPVLVTTFDNVRILATFVDGRDGPTLARIWDHGAAGYGIEIKSASTPNRWHEVTRTHCTCTAHMYRGHCSHAYCAHQAEVIFLAWQFAQRAQAQHQRRAAFAAAFGEVA